MYVAWQDCDALDWTSCALMCARACGMGRDGTARACCKTAMMRVEHVTKKLSCSGRCMRAANARTHPHTHGLQHNTDTRPRAHTLARRPALRTHQCTHARTHTKLTRTRNRRLAPHARAHTLIRAHMHNHTRTHARTRTHAHTHATQGSVQGTSRKAGYVNGTLQYSRRCRRGEYWAGEY